MKEPQASPLDKHSQDKDGGALFRGRPGRPVSGHLGRARRDYGKWPVLRAVMIATGLRSTIDYVTALAVLHEVLSKMPITPRARGKLRTLKKWEAHSDPRQRATRAENARKQRVLDDDEGYAYLRVQNAGVYAASRVMSPEERRVHFEASEARISQDESLIGRIASPEVRRAAFEESQEKYARLQMLFRKIVSREVSRAHRGRARYRDNIFDRRRFIERGLAAIPPADRERLWGRYAPKTILTYLEEADLLRGIFGRPARRAKAEKAIP